MKTTGLNHARRWLLPTALMLALGACASGAGDAPQPAVAAPAQFSLSGSAAPVHAGAVVARWWETLDDAPLNQLIDSAMTHNHDVALALANLQLARSSLQAASLERLPAIDTRVAGQDQRVADSAALPGSDTRFSSYQAGFDAVWELDLFGRTAQAVNAARAELDASQADLDQVYVSIAAEVARSYIQLRGAQHRLDVSQRNLLTLEQSLALTRQLVDGGLGDALDVQRAQTQLELARATLPTLQSEVEVAINRLSVLTGQPSGTLNSVLSAARPLPSMPPTLAVGEPLDLLKRRPDIRRAEHQLTAALAGYELSVAELYPRVSITGSIGFLATAFADLGSAGTFTHLVGPQLHWDALSPGRARNRIDAADARVQAQVAEFDQTVLVAFEEVDNAMVRLSREMQRRDTLRAAAQASALSSGYALERFTAGADSFLDVLDAQRTQLEAEDLLARSEIDLALQVIALYKALGGGWQR